VDDYRDVFVLRSGRADAVLGAVHVSQALEPSVPVQVLSGAQRPGPMVLQFLVVRSGPVPVGLYT